MTKRSIQKYRICRQLGEDVWGKLYKNINYKLRSGQHGKLKKKIKQYGFAFYNTKKIKLNSISKKDLLYKIKKYYINVSKKHFDKLYNNTQLVSLKDKTNKYEHNFIQLIEKRLDTIVYRLNWVTSFFAARQLINHGHILVNGNVVTISSHILNTGDIIEVKEESKGIITRNIISRFKNNDIRINSPTYLEVNYNILKAILISNPNIAFIPYPTIKGVSKLL